MRQGDLLHQRRPQRGQTPHVVVVVVERPVRRPPTGQGRTLDGCRVGRGGLLRGAGLQGEVGDLHVPVEAGCPQGVGVGRAMRHDLDEVRARVLGQVEAEGLQKGLVGRGRRVHAQELHRRDLLDDRVHCGSGRQRGQGCRRDGEGGNGQDQ